MKRFYYIFLTLIILSTGAYAQDLKPYANFSFDTVCLGKTTNFKDKSVSGNSNINKWEWTFGDGKYGSISNPSHTYAKGGKYKVTLKIINAAGLSDSISNIIIVNHPTAAFTFDTVAFGNLTHFKDLSKPIESGASIIKFLWAFDTLAFPIIPDTSHSQNPSYKYKNEGYHVVTLGIQDEKGCFDSISHHVLVKPSGVSCTANAGTDVTINDGESTILRGTGDGNYYWSNGANTANITVSPTTTSTYILTVYKNGCTATDQVIVTVITKKINYYPLGGMVMTGNSSSDVPVKYAGYALAFKADSNNFIIVDTATVTDLGYYYFDKLPEGNYLIKLCVGLHSNYLPTYYGDKLCWKDAQYINLNKNISDARINLIKADINIGTFSINGKVDYTVDKYKVSTINVFLVNTKNNSTIASVYTDSQGNYKFSNVIQGTYSIVADYPGKCCEKKNVNVEGNLNSIDNENITLQSCETGIDIYESSEIYSVSLYPNPVNDIVNFQINLNLIDNISIKIFDYSGRQILSNTYKNIDKDKLIQVPVSFLNNGMYFLSIYSVNGALLTTRKFIK
ncbi:MAG: PKD domain-containing protein [Bacteroidota bacterium]|nr:PKD domain-containing protein [Bacteroidota bacterium]